MASYDMKTGTRLYYAAIQADTAWSKLLQKQFGKQAGDIRYTKQGQGEPESALRAAYEAFRVTSDAWQDYARNHRD